MMECGKGVDGTQPFLGRRAPVRPKSSGPGPAGSRCRQSHEHTSPMSRVCENLDGSLKGGAKVSQQLFVQMLGLRCAKFLHKIRSARERHLLSAPRVAACSRASRFLNYDDCLIITLQPRPE